MPHRRTPAALRRRLEQDLVESLAYHDRLNREQIAWRTRTASFFMDGSEYTVVNYIDGEVLRDPYGSGTLQQVTTV